ncbi:MAG: heme lyase CcmF/NrfE family subunit [Firmicutes bacterium]|nr:heme lyase CcmF/NrfE family subunit [Bacillota bacterium]
MSVATMGQWTLALAGAVAVLGTVAAVAAAMYRTRGGIRPPAASGWTRFAAFGAFALVSASMAALLFALLTDDFRVAYVAHNSHRLQPIAFKIAALWSGQEGSLLFWTWLQAGYTALLAWQKPERMGNLQAPALGILLTAVAFFAGTTAFVASPFAELSSPPIDGRGLNPLLQSVWMISHPVLLYLGYVGVSVPFAVAMAALIVRRRGNDWIRLTRRWTMTAWLFLSLGIIVGARWAYEELGWGGYWAWDPVENASFMPWLTATAFIHSVIVQERRNMLKRWNAVLVTATYCLSVFGTFITRSGILSSVHTFVESELGPLFMVYLGAILAGGLYLILDRGDMLQDERAVESYASREFGFVLNNLILGGLAFAVFWGTVFPLVSRLMGVEVTVGAPYFNRITAPLFVALMLLMGIGPLLGWRRSNWAAVARQVAVPVGMAALAAGALFAGGVREPGFLLAVAGSVVVFGSVAVEVVQAAAARMKFTQDPPLLVLPRLLARNPRRYGGYAVHLAIAMIAMGIAGHTYYHQESLRGLAVGEQAAVGPYDVVFEGLEEGIRNGVPYTAARVRVKQNGQDLGYLLPAKVYHPGWSDMQGPSTEVAIYSTLAGDLYVVLAGWDEYGSVVGFQLFWNPMIGWLWFGGGLLVAGTMFALWPRPARAPAPAERVFEALRELEYDRAMGRIAAGEYARLRAALVRRAAELADAETAVRGALDRELAAELAARREAEG